MQIFDTIKNITLPKSSTCIALGLFDGLHTGHMAVIAAAVEKAKAAGLAPAVFTFTTNISAPAHKQPLKIITAGLFEDILSSIGVEYVFRPDFSEFSGIAPVDFINLLIGSFGAAYLFCGENFRFGKNAAAAAGDIYALCGNPEMAAVIPLVGDSAGTVSSSRIRELVQSGNIACANKLLGHRFSIDFKVVHGRALGRTLGTPTINQPFPADFAIPKFGVYATVTKIGGCIYSSVTNVGVKPTVSSDCALAETYIHDFAGNLYGACPIVEFVEFIRPEQKFPSLDMLKSQILKDSITAEKIIKSQITN